MQGKQYAKYFKNALQTELDVDGSQGAEYQKILQTSTSGDD